MGSGAPIFIVPSMAVALVGLALVMGTVALMGVAWLCGYACGQRNLWPPAPKADAD